MDKIRIKIAAIGMLAALIVVMLGAAAYLLFTGPRMLVQPHIRTFQTPMAPLPKGVVPVDMPQALPGADKALTMTNPVTATPENLARGKTYYDYYCAFCHGAGGLGDGPVGQSYLPAPTNLVSARVQSYSDGQLLRAMLLGTGHVPVLERIVPPEHRWYTVLYVRSLGNGRE